MGLGCRDDPTLSWVPSPVPSEGFGMDLLACTVSSGFWQGSPLGNSRPEGLESSLVPSVTPEPLFEGWQQLLGLKHCAICCVTPGQAVPALYSLVTHTLLLGYSLEDGSLPGLGREWGSTRAPRLPDCSTLGSRGVCTGLFHPRKSPWPFPSRRDGVGLGRQE